MSLTSIDLYETDGLLLFNSKSIIFQATDLERVIEKAENIFNFYLDFNWEIRFIGVNIRQSAEKKKGTSPFSIALFHNLIFIDPRNQCKSGFFEVYLSGKVEDALYKSRLCSKMRIWPGFSAQVFRDWADNRSNRRDLYKGEPFCRSFPVQARLVHEPSSSANQDITKTPRMAARRLERKTRLEPRLAIC